MSCLLEMCGRQTRIDTISKAFRDSGVLLKTRRPDLQVWRCGVDPTFRSGAAPCSGAALDCSCRSRPCARPHRLSPRPRGCGSPERDREPCRLIQLLNARQDYRMLATFV